MIKEINGDSKTILSLIEVDQQKQEENRQGILPPEILELLIKFIPYTGGSSFSLSCKHFFLIHRKEMASQIMPVIIRKTENDLIVAHIKQTAILKDADKNTICNLKNTVIKIKVTVQYSPFVKSSYNVKLSDLLTIKNLGKLPSKLFPPKKIVPDSHSQRIYFPYHFGEYINGWG